MLLTQALNAETNLLSGPEKYRRLVPEADARRRSREDDVTRLQAHVATQIADEERHPENHRARRAVLKSLAIDVEPELERRPITNVIPRHQPGADRPERIGALPLGPLSGTFQLKGAFGHVVGDSEASDVIEGMFFRDVFPGLPDDDAELDFPIRFG